MYQQQPFHVARDPWGAPAPHAYFPNGDLAQDRQQPAWAAPPPPIDPYFPVQIPQPLGAPHVRPQPQLDAAALRIKEEQRRRQQEYSQALAEQVRLREQQKKQEKDARRREDAMIEAPHGGPHGAGPQAGPLPDRGLFDGLGQNNPSQGTNFGRGRRQPTAAPVHAQAALPNPSVNLPPPHHPPYHAHGHEMQSSHYVPQHQVGWSGHAEALGLVEPQHHSGDPAHAQPQQDASWSAHQHHGHPHHAPQYQQQAPPMGGHRVRTDLHDGGAGGGPHDDGKKQLRLQQQLDMQESLRRQIEEKQRQKLEEKRKREEDERREMEKFELEKRRQHEEQERLKDEKRRKALAEEEHFRAQQQQLAAATAAAQEQRQHRHHHSPAKGEMMAPHQSPYRNHHANADARPPQQHQSPPRNRQAHVPPHVQAAGLQGKNPFTNSRAHLFEDPPSPQRPSHHHHLPAQPSTGHEGYHGDHQVAASSHHANRSHAVPVDTHLLMEQYEQVRVELERQRQLVEQLHAQMQHQQRQRQPHEELPRELPTVSDLERLRQELRDELAHREAQHRLELDALRRQQQQPQHRSQEPSPVPRPSHHEQRSPPRNQARRSVPQQRAGPGRRHDAFVQDALNEEDEDLETSMGHEDHHLHDNQSTSPDGSLQRSAQLGLRGSLSAASLQCESKLVFFDGRVHQQQQHAVARTSHRPPDPSMAKHATLEDEPALENESRLEHAVGERVGHVGLSVGSNPQRGVRASDNQQEPRLHKPTHSSHAEEKGDEDDSDDALGFFVRRVDPREHEPERYRSVDLSTSTHAKSSTSLAASQSLGRLTVLEDVESDEQDDEADSLDGDTLEAIFQRNLRRHEILSGFEAQNQRRAPDATHWHELHRRLQGVPDEVAKHTATRAKAHAEPSLTTSSRWMPSSSSVLR